MDDIKIVTRSSLPEDKDFVMATWLNGNRYGNPYFKRQESENYYRSYSDHIIKTLLTPGVQVNVACGDHNPNWIVGFSVFKDETLHWIHVKESYRLSGIATLLLKDQPITTVKGLTKLGWSILQKKGLIYDPR